MLDFCGAHESLNRADGASRSSDRLSIYLDWATNSKERLFERCDYLSSLHEDLSSIYGEKHFAFPILSGMGFSIECALTGRYTLNDPASGMQYISRETYPLLIHCDRRVAVRFRIQNCGDILIIVDEHWGMPYMVYDMESREYWQVSVSTIPETQGVSLAEAALTLLNAFSAKDEGFSGLTINDKENEEIVLIGGGYTNISHFFWNDLGGFCTYASLSGKNTKIRSAIVLSNMFFLEGLFTTSANTNILNSFDSVDWQDRYIALTRQGLGKAAFVRLSSLGVPAIARNHIIFSARNEALPSSEQAPCLSSKTIITITLRSGRRTLVDQCEVFLSAIKHLAHYHWKNPIHVLIDGPCAESGLLRKGDRPQQSQSQNFQKELLSLGISSDDFTGLPLKDQIRAYSRSDVVLTYYSGGIAKFLSFSNSPIVLIGPSDLLPHEIFRAQQLPEIFRQRILNTSLNGAIFWVHRLNMAYLNLIIPPTTIDPAVVRSKEPDKGFHTDFEIYEWQAISDALRNSLLWRKNTPNPEMASRTQ